MVQLSVLADDFTGAMDTGVQFAKLGIKTLVGTDISALLTNAGDVQVLAVDTETRHMPPAQAYQTVYRQAGACRQAGIPYLYKKTDSALRGNAGAELAAALQAWGWASLPFVPAYPQTGRTTKNGIHYISGIPVAESAFGKDSFSPVLCSDVVCWLARQSGVPVINAGGKEPCSPFIEVYDAETEADLKRIAVSLKDAGRLGVMAGCAGLASVLPDMLPLIRGKVEALSSTGRLTVLCGSMHPATKEQIRHAADRGFRHIRLTPAQKLGREGRDTLEHRAFISLLTRLCQEAAPVIIDANDEHGETMAYARAEGLALSDVRRDISSSMGHLGRELLLAGMDRTLLITGGDTLMGFMAAWGRGSLRPVCELMPGIVRALFEIDGKSYDIITKSGGFGEKSLFTDIAEQP